MKKAGAKPAQLVRSASRRNKTPSKFQFDITVDRIYGATVKAGYSYSVKWARGVKVAQTRSVSAQRSHVGGTKSGGGLPVGEKISLLVTLYRSGDKSGSFDPKDAKLSLIAINSKNQEKVVAKLQFDIAPLAGIPSSSSSRAFQLSDKATIVAVVDSRLVKSGQSGPGSGGASSALSGMTGASDEDDGNADDFDDLNVDDVPDPDSSPSSPAPSSIRSGSRPTRSPAVRGAADLSMRKEAVGYEFSSGSREPSRPSSSSSTPKAYPKPGSALAMAQELRLRRGDSLTEDPNSNDDRNYQGKLSSASLRSTGSNDPSMSTGGTDAESLLARLKKLQEEKNGLELDLRRSQEKRKRIEASHAAEIQRLRAGGASPSTSSARAAADAQKIEDLRARVDSLTDDLATAKSEKDSLKVECEKLRPTTREVERLRERNKEMSAEVDRLTIAAASGGGREGDAAVERRIAQLQADRESVEAKLRAHQAHSSKVRETYEKLSGMYNKLREENIELQRKADDLERKLSEGGTTAETEGASDPDSTLRERVSELEANLSSARRECRDLQSSKESVERDNERLGTQLETVNERTESLAKELEVSREEADELHAEAEELKIQLNNAMKRVEDKNRNSGRVSPALEARHAEAVQAKELAEREIVRTKQRVSECEREIADLLEDLDYEKAEKIKAREERDALRESARSLERRTSEASQNADAIHALQRQLSTHRMRDADQSAMIADLREEIEQLHDDLAVARKGGGRGGDALAVAAAQGSEADVLEELVVTKLALATAEDEKLQLRFELKNIKASEKAIQDKLAAHASRLEVKLSETTDELQRLRDDRDHMRSRLSDASF